MPRPSYTSNIFVWNFGIPGYKAIANVHVSFIAVDGKKKAINKELQYIWAQWRTSTS